MDNAASISDSSSQNRIHFRPRYAGQINTRKTERQKIKDCIALYKIFGQGDLVEARIHQRANDIVHDPQSIDELYKRLEKDDHSFKYRTYKNFYQEISGAEYDPNTPYQNVDQMVETYNRQSLLRRTFRKIFDAPHNSEQARRLCITKAKETELQWCNKALTLLIEDEKREEEARKREEEARKRKEEAKKREEEALKKREEESRRRAEEIRKRREEEARKKQEEERYFANILNGAKSVDEFLSVSKNGTDYETRMCKLLNACGFKCEKTKAGADQGVDLIVSTRSASIALQCKFYNSPVGNQAVQAVVAGKAVYKCTSACVVSNASYTQAAHIAADANHVALLHHNDLLNFLKSNLP